MCGGADRVVPAHGLSKPSHFFPDSWIATVHLSKIHHRACEEPETYCLNINSSLYAQCSSLLLYIMRGSQRIMFRIVYLLSLNNLMLYLCYWLIIARNGCQLLFETVKNILKALSISLSELLVNICHWNEAWNKYNSNSLSTTAQIVQYANVCLLPTPK